MDRQLQNKLQQYSAAPPAGAWQKIADALDADKSFSNRLFTFEATPPPAAWEKIELGLAGSPNTGEKQFTTRSRHRLRYLAAAALLAAAVVTITLTSKRQDANPADSTAIAKTGNGYKTTPSVPVEPDTKNRTSPVPNDNTIGKKPSPPPLLASVPAKPRPKSNRQNDGNILHSSLNEYVVFSDDDGQVRRVSKKLAEYVNCKEDDARCKQRLKELRQRMAANAMTTDFTGILEMLRQLQ